MSKKIYTITQNGSSGGNVITQPFTIEVHQVGFVEIEGRTDRMVITVCTKNGSGITCQNDDIPNTTEYIDGREFLTGEGNYSFPAKTTSRNANLVGTIEKHLEDKYPGKWKGN